MPPLIPNARRCSRVTIFDHVYKRSDCGVRPYTRHRPSATITTVRTINHHAPGCDLSTRPFAVPMRHVTTARREERIGRRKSDDKRDYDDSRRAKNGRHHERKGKGREPVIVSKTRSAGPKDWSFRSDKKPTPEKFADSLKDRLNTLRPSLLESRLLAALQKEAGDRSQKVETSEQTWRNFINSVSGNGDSSAMKQRNTPVRDRLQDAYLNRGGNTALDERIRYEFYDFLINNKFTASDLSALKRVADLRYPSEWYPATRRIKRTVHLHVGPTNSGKTYHALKRLEQAETGVYAGPLRLLAHEVYARLNASGKQCALITGEERRNALKADGTEMEFVDDVIKLRSCTVEMVPLNMIMDVAVLDEIQMIADEYRGWAWTQAFLGLSAKELHLCGEERAVPLIKELCAMVGDEVHVHKYERLSPLRMDDESIKGDLKKLRKGDAVISFSVMGIHALRKEIQAVTGKKAAIVYGSLPPETRAQQARLFNDPDNDYDFLVASDAVGMGLNLAIKRVIFEASYKFNGYSVQRLRISDIKQIGGRAGRYKVPGQNKDESTLAKSETLLEGAPPKKARSAESVGLITTLDAFDFPIVAKAMVSEPEPIRSAGILPPMSIVERFANYFPAATPFSYIIMRLNEMGLAQSRFHLCTLKDQLKIAHYIDEIPGLSITDRAIMSAAPSGRMTEWAGRLVQSLARCIATQQGGNILDIPDLPLEILEDEITGTREQLNGLESLHGALVIYLWLSFRFAGVFTARPLAVHIKGMVEERIEMALNRMGMTEQQRKRAYEERRRKLIESESAEAENERRRALDIDGEGRGTEEEEERGLDRRDVEEVGGGKRRSAEGVEEVDGEEEGGYLPERNVRFTEEEDVPYIDPAEEEAIADGNQKK